MSRPHYIITESRYSEPVTYEQAAEFLRLSSDDEVALVESLIAVAREYVEGVTGRAMIRASYRATAESWEAFREGDRYVIGRTPLVAVTGISYIGPEGGARQVLAPADYVVITGTEPGSLYFPNELPPLKARPDAVEIEFDAGPDDLAACSPLLRHCVKVLVAHLYELRMPVAVGNIVNVLPTHLQALIQNQRVGGFIS
jgi:uncharacterized phiE125 gp8 family phage protein